MAVEDDHRPPPAVMGPPDREPQRVLLAAIALDSRDGSAMHVHDLAIELGALGDDVVVYTPRAGAVADAMRARGVGVVTSLDDLPWRPDVIHGHHTLETVAASLAHPDVPVVFTCHGQGWMAEPPRLSSLVEWIAVGTATVARLVAAGVPTDRVSLIPNGVDTERFRPTRAAPPRSPRRALVFSNNAAPGGWVEVVLATCAQRGVEVEVAGRAWGRPLDAPEEVLPEFDLVFARGRCAREAIASGCAVVLTDVEGLAGMVDREHLERYDGGSMGAAALTNPHDPVLLGAEIDRYDAEEVAATTAQLRATESLAAMTSHVRQVHLRARAAPRRAPAPGADAAWVLGRLGLLSGLGLDRDEVLLSRHLVWVERESLAERLARAEARVIELERDLRELRGTRVVRARDAVLSSRVGGVVRRVARPSR